MPAMRSIFLISCVLITVSCTLRTDQEFWTTLAEIELEEARKTKYNNGIAKNIILFVGDGMGPNTVTATRIYKGGETHRLAFEKFPHMGLLKTYSANKMVSDSASTATALFCGVKTNMYSVGVDATVTDCATSMNNKARLKSLAAVALRAGKSAGFVTTMRVTHATPSPLYAHSPARRWECDSAVPAGSEDCKDHARQLIENWPGRDLNVILGGGLKSLSTNTTGPTDPWNCARQDGRELIETYKRDKESRGLNYSVVFNTKELMNIDNDTDYLLGIFADSHLPYEYQRDKSPEGVPSISEMVATAIKVLNRNQRGFFLMVEGGNIDMAHHRGRAKLAINEAAAMEDAVQVAMAATDEEDTLLIVTSDHTHTLNINGYPERGSDIFGIAQNSPYDGINYTTLAYSTGGPESFQYEVRAEDSKVVRREPSLSDTKSMEYEQIAGITLLENSHGGGDVTIYARGPHAHLFHNVHEQHYVYHAILYAAKMDKSRSISPASTLSSIIVLLSLVVLFLLK